MCGFIAAFGNREPLLSESALGCALKRLYRRGPDDEGVWHGEGVIFGHRRLAILDLEHRAAQPMSSSCGRYVIVFNGEIYNYQALRHDLKTKDIEFHTNSDTEVILALFATEGEAMLTKLHGMFALAIWDRMERRAFVARDPYGIKPLYIWESGGVVMVASQVRALLATGKVSTAPDPRGQAGFWMLGSVPEPHTWFRDIRALPAGCCAWITKGRLGSLRRWQDIGEVWREASLLRTTKADIQNEVEFALRESVGRHLVSDVPVGIFLSGGIDSGAIAGLMVEEGAKNLEGVTISYNEYTNRHEDEAPVAASLAAYYGIRHTVRRVTRDEFLADLPRILDAMDQPSIDGVNTWYASKAVAERGIKVVVSGVGGDELFQGYTNFKTLPKLLNTRRRLLAIPGVDFLLEMVGGNQSRRTGNRRWNHLAEWSRSIEGLWWLTRSVRAPEELGEVMDPGLAREVLTAFDATAWVREMTGRIPEDASLALGQIESMTYLRNQLLRDSDWASMDHSVELRTPLVDAKLLNSIRNSLPSLKYFSGKRLLANAAQKPLPCVVAERRKTGFGIPVDRWLKGYRISPGASDCNSWAWTLAQAYSSIAASEGACA